MPNLFSDIFPTFTGVKAFRKRTPVLEPTRRIDPESQNLFADMFPTGPPEPREYTPFGLGKGAKRQIERLAAPVLGVEYTIRTAPQAFGGLAREFEEKARKLARVTTEEKTFGEKIIEQNRAKVRALGLEPPQEPVANFLFAAGSGVTTMAGALGLTLLTKSPHVAAVAFGLYQKGNIYQDAREHGVSIEMASALSTAAGGVEGALEYIGLDLIFRSPAQGFLKKAVFNSMTEAFQEYSQQLGENVIAGLYSDRRLLDGLFQAAVIGGLLGGGVGGISGVIQSDMNDALSERGIDPESELGQGLMQSLAQRAQEAALAVTTDVHKTLTTETGFARIRKAKGQVVRPAKGKKPVSLVSEAKKYKTADVTVFPTGKENVLAEIKEAIKKAPGTLHLGDKNQTIEAYEKENLLNRDNPTWFQKDPIKTDPKTIGFKIDGGLNIINDKAALWEVYQKVKATAPKLPAPPKPKKISVPKGKGREAIVEGFKKDIVAFEKKIDRLEREEMGIEYADLTPKQKKDRRELIKKDIAYFKESLKTAKENIRFKGIKPTVKPVTPKVPVKQPWEMTQKEFAETPIIKYIESAKRMSKTERDQLSNQLVDMGLMSIDDFNYMTDQFGRGGPVTPVSTVEGKPIPSKPVEGDFGEQLKNIAQWHTFKNVPLFAHRKSIIRALVDGKTVSKKVIDSYKGWGWILADGTTAHTPAGEKTRRGVTLQESVESYGVKFNPGLITEAQKEVKPEVKPTVAETVDLGSTHAEKKGIPPDEMVTVYRASEKGDKIKSGNFVTTSREQARFYAQDIVGQRGGAKATIVTQKVRAGDIRLKKSQEAIGVDDAFIYTPRIEKVKPAVKPIITPKVTEVPPIPPKEIKGLEGPEGEGQDVSVEYEKQKDIWFGKKDVRILQSEIEQRQLQKEIPQALGKIKYDEETKGYDKAIQIYIDTKRNPEHIKQYYDKLSDEQKRTVDLSQNLPPKVKAIADKISKSYEKIGLEALDQEVIRNVLENYAARVWNIEGKQATEKFRKFGTKTGHAKARRFETIIEGWANEFNLKVEGATTNLQILKEEISKTIEDKKFIKSLQKLKTIDGEALLSIKQLEGYVSIEHPNFKIWKWAGKAKKGETYGKNFFVTEKGDLFERRSLYAPKEQAKNLNNILGISKLKGIGFIDVATKYNAIIKSFILQSSFFHHLAFMRSYYFGTQHKKWNEMNIRKAYKQGIQAIEEENPIIMLGVKNGLTLGLKQDWNEELLHEKTAIGALLDRIKVVGEVKDKIMDLRQQHADFLFGEFGAGLKAKSFMIEYRNLLQKHSDKTSDELAKMAANLINDDFGGLHLQRLGRNPTVQHIFRLFALAPDWTESNVRTMVKAFRAGSKEEAAFYRKFWAGVFTKGAILTVLGNALMAGLDEDDPEAKGFVERLKRNYKRAWREGRMRWLDVDITALYKILGGKTENRKYFSVLGHFKDPIKFVTHPVRSAQHKGSVVYRFFHEALTGVDWAGRRFTTTPELLGIDKEKGFYKTTRKGYYKEGDPKWGKLKGQTVTWDFKGKGPLDYNQVLSYSLAQAKGSLPVQIQNLIAWLNGEMEGFDALLKSAGLRVSTTYDKPEKKKKAKAIRPALGRRIRPVRRAKLKRPTRGQRRR